MRRPNGEGCVTKLQGTRRKPWMVKITIGTKINTLSGKSRNVQKVLGCYQSRREALEALAEFNKNPFDLTQNPTFGEVLEIVMAKRQKEVAMSTYGSLKSAKKYLQDLEDREVRTLKLNQLQYAVDLGCELSGSYQGRIIELIKEVYAYCMKHDMINRDYSQYLEKTASNDTKNERKPFTDDEIKLILEHDHWEPPYDYAYTLPILLYTGMRINEMLSLKCCDIHMDERYIEVHGTKTGSADRIVPIHKMLEPIIREHMTPERTYLVSSKLGNKVYYADYHSNFWMPYMESLGISHTIHETRHTFSTLLHRAGVKVESPEHDAIMGHSNRNVTRTYIHESIQDLIEAVDKYTLININ